MTKIYTVQLDDYTKHVRVNDYVYVRDEDYDNREISVLVTQILSVHEGMKTEVQFIGAIED